MRKSWYGRFTSSTVPHVYGRIDTELQSEFTSEKVESKLTFTYTGAYRNGQRIVFDIESWLNEYNGLNFGVKNNNEFLSVQYNIDSFSPTKISGTYITNGPYDKGTFVIVPEGEPEPQIHNNGLCTIC